MTRDELLKLPEGTILVTPFVPVGRFRLTKVEQDTVFGFFEHKHAGCAKDSPARYYISEVRTVEQAEAQCKGGHAVASTGLCVQCGKEGKCQTSS